MLVVKCPECGEEHGLYWVEQANDNRVLYYRCNKHKVLVGAKEDASSKPRLVFRTRQVPVDDLLLLHKAEADVTVPVKWSKGKARREQKSKQAELF